MMHSILIATRRLVRNGFSVVAIALACRDSDPRAAMPTHPDPGHEPSGLMIWSTLAAQGDDSAWTGSAFVTTPAVRVVRVVPGSPLSPTGNPGVAGVTVRFAVTEGGGSVRDTAAVTDGFGLASCNGWTLGPNAGPNSVTVIVTGATPLTITKFARTRPYVVASYKLIAREGFGNHPDLTLAGGQIVLGDDGSMESGLDYFWNLTNPGGFPLPPSSWTLSPYWINGSTLHLPDPSSAGEIRGDTLIITTVSDEDPEVPPMRTVYVRSSPAPAALRSSLSHFRRAHQTSAPGETRGPVK